MAHILHSNEAMAKTKWPACIQKVGIVSFYCYTDICKWRCIHVYSNIYTIYIEELRNTQTCTNNPGELRIRMNFLMDKLLKYIHNWYRFSFSLPPPTWLCIYKLEWIIGNISKTRRAISSRVPVPVKIYHFLSQINP